MSLRGCVLLSFVVLCASACRTSTYVDRPKETVALTLSERSWVTKERRTIEDQAERQARDDRARELIKLGKAEIKTEPDNATDLFRSAFKVAQDEKLAAEALFLAAEAAYENRKLELSHKLYRFYLKLFPVSVRYSTILDRIFLVGKTSLVESPTSKFYRFFNDSARDLGIKILEDFVTDYDRHPSADDALYIVGVNQLQTGDPVASQETLKRLIEDYPESEWRRLAEFRIAQAQIEISDSPERDQRPMLEALATLRRYLKRFPTEDEAKEAERTLRELEERLAGHELVVARFYLKQDKPKGYEIYLKHIILAYPKTQSAEQAKGLLAKHQAEADEG